MNESEKQLDILKNESPSVIEELKISNDIAREEFLNIYNKPYTPPIDKQKELLIEGAKKVLAHYKTKHKINSLADYNSPGLQELAQALE